MHYNNIIPAMKKYLGLTLFSLFFLKAYAQERPWWQGTVIYQVYPQSFKDTNGDGVGDLKGIIGKLDYLKELGIETIWINPFYKSPGFDNGYDISDYLAVDPKYGTMADFDALLAGLKKRKMRLVMDMVLNHTSDEHAWFLRARTSRDNPFHDFYIWKQGRKDSLPNNWPSIFGGSAWKWNEQTQEFYLHTFLDKQPDLNWDNPQVRQELYKIMRFWLDKGVDGFRLDAISLISKNKAFPAMDCSSGVFAALESKVNNGPYLHEYLQEMYREVLAPYHTYVVGEVYTDKDNAWKYVAPERHELSAIHYFDLLWLNDGSKAAPVKNILDGWNAALQSNDNWNTVMLTTHDYPRAVSRLGNDRQYRVQSAKLLATLQLSYRGTPFIFQGEELGMTSYPFKDISEIKDVTAHAQYASLKQHGMSDSAAFAVVKHTTRDNARTPMQWDASANAGFSAAGKTWLPVNPNYKSINAAEEMASKGSVYHYYQKLIALRKKYPSLVYGAFDDLLPADTSVYVFTRTTNKEQWLIVLNMTDKTVNYYTGKASTLVLSSYGLPGNGQAATLLQPYEARIYGLKR
jgi:oligo-1,6-glucosidase